MSDSRADLSRDEFVQAMDAFWTRVQAEGMANKDSREATRELMKLYRRFDHCEQSTAREVIVGWLRSEDRQGNSTPSCWWTN